MLESKNMLTFKRKFLDAIRRGEKTQTLRIWRHLRVRSGQKSYIPGVGPIIIDSVEQVTFSELTDTDAIPDGFPSIAALKQEIINIYGSLPEGEMYRIRFHLLEETNKNTEKEAVDLPKIVAHTTEQNTKEPPFVCGMKGNLLESLSSNNFEETNKNEPNAPIQTSNGLLTESEVVKKLIQRCKINRNVCDWNHEPGKSQDFFALFRRSPRDERGVPTLDGYRIRSLIRDQLTPEEWKPICWIVEEVCRAWTEWQYAVERWSFPE